MADLELFPKKQQVLWFIVLRVIPRGFITTINGSISMLDTHTHTHTHRPISWFTVIRHLFYFSVALIKLHCSISTPSHLHWTQTTHSHSTHSHRRNGAFSAQALEKADRFIWIQSLWPGYQLYQPSNSQFSQSYHYPSCSLCFSSQESLFKCHSFNCVSFFSFLFFILVKYT